MRRNHTIAHHAAYAALVQPETLGQPDQFQLTWNRVDKELDGILDARGELELD